MVIILMMSAKLATPGIPKIKIFQNKYYDVIIPKCVVASKYLLHDSSSTVSVVIDQKFVTLAFQ